MTVPSHSDPRLEQRLFRKGFDAEFQTGDRAGPVDLGETHLLTGRKRKRLLNRLVACGRLGVLPELLGIPKRQERERHLSGRPGWNARIFAEGVVGEMAPMAAAGIGNAVVTAHPGLLMVARSAGQAAQGDFQPFLEHHRAVHRAKLRAAIHTQRLAKDAERILLAEERGDIHVDAGLLFAVEIVANVDALRVGQAIAGSHPDIHLLTIETARPRGVKKHGLAVRFHVESEIVPIVVVAGAVEGAELMGLHAGAKPREVFNLQQIAPHAIVRLLARCR